jgi:hypothetical protein
MPPLRTTALHDRLTESMREEVDYDTDDNVAESMGEEADYDIDDKMADNEGIGRGGPTTNPAEATQPPTQAESRGERR